MLISHSNRNENHNGFFSKFAELKSEFKTQKLNCVRNLASFGIDHSIGIENISE